MVGIRGWMMEVAGPIHAISVSARIVIDTDGRYRRPPFHPLRGDRAAMLS
jgi:hypothetical protein